MSFLKPHHHTVLVLVREDRVTYQDAMPDEDGYRIDGRQPDWHSCTALGDLLAAKLISRPPAGTGVVPVGLTDDGRTVAR